MSRRDEIRMSRGELEAFLGECSIVACATVGRDGMAHVMPLWFLLRDGDVWVWTYAASQKVRNLERDPRATLMFEAGERYEELRGAMLKVEAVIERDPDLVAALGLAIYSRYYDEISHDIHESVQRQAPKRVAIRFVEHSRATWDHRKLATAS